MVMKNKNQFHQLFAEKCINFIKGSHENVNFVKESQKMKILLKNHRKMVNIDFFFRISPLVQKFGHIKYPESWQMVTEKFNFFNRTQKKNHKISQRVAEKTHN